MLSNSPPAASPHEQPVPIVSLAKVMTAYLTLERYPLSGAQNGATQLVESIVPAAGVRAIAASGPAGARRGAAAVASGCHQLPVPPPHNLDVNPIATRGRTDE